ncbi:FAD binding domain-containing protein [Paractinoplanes atraurantiacus]|uniref:CO or xanthine dehydrogenase, FAD-binding subunit n=1 Tax=Paractinoplanes atraurantiacus TaxID=1036182 RepID=A0A285HU39_9ACTN|nr:FAD binding domain-containing protein [Actinoplanes atraurantiacus]SNY39220.1 CO or xanthine dehydrogenase, FAD-binding subunit [Actinoplanes atraurantiacus]
MLTEVHVPEDVPAAVSLVAAGATIIGGGTSLMPRLNDYASPPTELVSLRRAGLAGVHVDGDTVTIGAMTTLAQIEHDPRLALLHPVVRSIASVPVRTLATVGGNLFARQPHGDLTVALVALNARATLAGRSESELPLTEAGLVTAITAKIPKKGAFRYLKAARRRYNSASLVTVAATIHDESGEVTIALGGVSDRVVRAHAAEAVLSGRPLTEETVHAAAEAELAHLTPADDAYASAWYRKRVFPVHLRRALLGR